MTSRRCSASSWAMLLGVGAALFVVYLLGERGSAVEAWPGGSAMYECCCDDSSGCRKSCFMCRNVDFVCNCGSCSCYLDSGLEDADDAVSRNDLLSMLIRSGGGKKSRSEWRYGQYGPGRQPLHKHPPPCHVSCYQPIKTSIIVHFIQVHCVVERFTIPAVVVQMLIERRSFYDCILLCNIIL